MSRFLQNGMPNNSDAFFPLMKKKQPNASEENSFICRQFIAPIASQKWDSASLIT